jgi:DNA polymerase III alpha subunit
VYQEDVTKVAMQLAGFGVVDAEGLRKVLAKKARRGKLEDYRTAFEDGCRRNGVARSVVDAAWDMMMAFSGYSFCKPHSASYCQVSFQSAWLKVHYPAAFMAGVISNFGGFYSTQAYISEAQRLGLTVVPPDINRSAKRCSSHGRELLIGLLLIKGLSAEAQDKLIADRQARGAYASIADVVERTGLDEADGERLIAAGACDSLDPERNRPRLFWQLRRAFRGIAGDHATPALRGYSPAQLLVKEYDALGFLTSTHPITLVRPQPRGRAILIREIRARVGDIVGFYGWCVTSRTLTTEQGAGMQFVTFEDETGIVETVLFPDVYAGFARLLAHREAFLVWGKVTEDFGAVVVEVKGVRATPRAGN